jgi:hypothetical protein
MSATDEPSGPAALPEVRASRCGPGYDHPVLSCLDWCAPVCWKDWKEERSDLD